MLVMLVALSLLLVALALALALVHVLVHVLAARTARRPPARSVTPTSESPDLPRRVSVVVPVRTGDVGDLPRVMAGLTGGVPGACSTRVTVLAQDLDLGTEQRVSARWGAGQAAEVVCDHSGSDGRALSRVAVAERLHCDALAVVRPAYPVTGVELAACLVALADPAVAAVQPVAGADRTDRLRDAHGVAVLVPTSHVVRASAFWAAGGWHAGVTSPEADLGARLLAQGRVVRMLDLGAGSGVGSPTAAAVWHAALAVLRRPTTLLLRPRRAGLRPLGRTQRCVLAATALAALTRPAAAGPLAREVGAAIVRLPGAAALRGRRLAAGARAGDRRAWLGLASAAMLVPVVALLLPLLQDWSADEQRRVPRLSVAWTEPSAEATAPVRPTSQSSRARPAAPSPTARQLLGATGVPLALTPGGLAGAAATLVVDRPDGGASGSPATTTTTTTRDRASGPTAASAPRTRAPSPTSPRPVPRPTVPIVPAVPIVPTLPLPPGPSGSDDPTSRPAPAPEPAPQPAPEPDPAPPAP